jgi:hypothetical protein
MIVEEGGTPDPERRHMQHFERDLAENLVRALQKSVGGGFHPDTKGLDYVRADGTPSMAPDIAELYDSVMAYAYDTLGDDLYAVALDALNESA